MTCPSCFSEEIIEEDDFFKCKNNNYYSKDKCEFIMFKEQKYLGCKIDLAQFKKLLNNEILESKKGIKYCLDTDEKYNIKFLVEKYEINKKFPNIRIYPSNYYHETLRFGIKKEIERRRLTISIEEASELFLGRRIKKIHKNMYQQKRLVEIYIFKKELKFYFYE